MRWFDRGFDSGLLQFGLQKVFVRLTLTQRVIEVCDPRALLGDWKLCDAFARQRLDGRVGSDRGSGGR
jgi:hypothetical protein